MSLQVDGVWKALVWAATVWADGVWFEGGSPAPSPAPARPAGGWYHNIPRKWSVERDGKEYLFDTPQEALRFYEGDTGDDRPVKRIRRLGKATVAYAGQDLRKIRVNRLRGTDLLREAARLPEIQRAIEASAEAQIAAILMAIATEEEELLLLAAATVA